MPVTVVISGCGCCGSPGSPFVGTANGEAFASAIGVAAAFSIGTALASSTASAVGVSVFTSVGTASGTSSASAVSASINRSVGTASGTSTASAVSLVSSGMQYVGNGNGGTLTSSISASWIRPTQTNNLLYTVLAFGANPGTITAPAGGWTLIDSTSSAPFVYTYYIQGAASQSGAQTWSYTNSQNPVVIAIAEYNQTRSTTAALDQHNVNTGNSTTPATSSATTTAASEWLVASHVLYPAFGSLSPSWSSPTNSFAIEATTQAGLLHGQHIGLALCDHYVGSTGTYSTGITSTQSGPWVSMFATFK